MENHSTFGHKKPTLSTFLKSPLGEYVFLALIFFLALLVRRIGLQFGNPFITHADEWTIIEPAIEMTRNRTLDSNNYVRPDQITQFLNFVYSLVFAN